MNTENVPGAEPTGLDFINLATQHFAFLRDLGFVESESFPKMVHYQKDGIEIDVYHGRQSYEIGFGIFHDGVRYSLPEFMRLTDPAIEEHYLYPTATTRKDLAEGLAKTAELVKRYCMQVLQGDTTLFATLASQRKLWAQKYELDVLEGQLRLKANEAFRLGRYREAVKFYKRIESRLSPAEIKKLAVAEERSNGASEGQG